MEKQICEFIEKKSTHPMSFQGRNERETEIGKIIFTVTYSVEDETGTISSICHNTYNLLLSLYILSRN